MAITERPSIGLRAKTPTAGKLWTATVRWARPTAWRSGPATRRAFRTPAGARTRGGPEITNQISTKGRRCRICGSAAQPVSHVSAHVRRFVPILRAGWHLYTYQQTGRGVGPCERLLRWMWIAPVSLCLHGNTSVTRFHLADYSGTPRKF